MSGHTYKNFTYKPKRVDFASEDEFVFFRIMIHSHVPSGTEKVMAAGQMGRPLSLKEHLSVLDREHLQFISEGVEGKKNSTLRKALLIDRLAEMIPEKFRNFLNHAHPIVFDYLTYETGIPFPAHKLYGEDILAALTEVQDYKLDAAIYGLPSRIFFRGQMLDCAYTYYMPEEDGYHIQYPQEILDVLAEYASDEQVMAEHAEVFDVFFVAEAACFLYGAFSYPELEALLRGRLGREVSREKINSLLSQRDQQFKDTYYFVWKKESGKYWASGTLLVRPEIRVNLKQVNQAATQWLPSLRTLASIYCYGLDMSDPVIAKTVQTYEKKLSSVDEALMRLNELFEIVQKASLGSYDAERFINALRPRSQSEYQAYMNMIQDFVNRLPRWGNKGYPPLTLIEEQVRVAAGAVGGDA